MDKQYSVQFFTKFVEAMQKFCRDYIEFEQAVELSGYLSLEIDNYKKERYVLSEMVHSTGDVISESYCVKAFKTMKRLPVIRDHTNTLRLSQDDSIDLRDSPPQYGIPYQTTSSRQRTHIHQTSPNRHNISSQQSYRQTMNRRHNPPSFASGGQNSNAFTTSSSSSAQLEEPSTIQPRQSVQYLTSASHSSPVMALVPSLDDVEADHSSGTSNMNPLVSSADNIQSDESRGQKRSTVQEETSPNKKEKLDNELESLFSAATSIVTVSEGNVDFSTTVGEKVPQSQDVNLDIPNSDQSTSQSHSVSESLRLPESIQIKEEVDPDIMFIDSPGDRSGSEPGGYGADAQSFTSSAEAASSDPKSLQTMDQEEILPLKVEIGEPPKEKDPAYTPVEITENEGEAKRFKSRWSASLKRHVLSHTDQIFFCECKKRFTSKWELKYHRNICRHGLSCDQCAKKFSTRQGLRLHIRTAHKKSYPYTCAVCKFHCVTKNQYIGHMNKHTNNNEKCQCGASFLHPADYAHHLKGCQKKNIVKHLCSHCGLEFHRKQHLVAHINGMHSEPKHKCEKCFKAFKWSSSLSYHHKHSKCQLLDN
ncbi:zinc finger protein 37-like isoform X2 [Gigantopelta aegis]|uniref:zinc finger protein 37-like isoform X2 n=1 Tax=Gigantopelta aegis TaxID=1735272 RepID=UPI001B889F5E|nr:zinc finger protein 37-like isoform X2 [Gigantopelta aegis]